MISDIKKAASDSGITAIVSNARDKIETQLNRITGIEELPIMLVSWDLETTLEFDENGFLKNPSTKVVFLLMTKAESAEKNDYEEAAEEMAKLFQSFLVNLNSYLVRYNKEGGQNLTGITHTLVPMHGMGKHSGIIGGFNMINQITSC